jgi:hypothetical protein
MAWYAERKLSYAGLRTFADRGDRFLHRKTYGRLSWPQTQIPASSPPSYAAQDETIEGPHIGSTETQLVHQNPPAMTRHAYDTSRVTYIKPETRCVEENIHERYARALAPHIYCL